MTDHHVVRSPMAGPRPSAEASAVLASRAFRDLVAERVAQIDQHGFTRAHDAGHHPAQLALAASSYLNEAVHQLTRRGWDAAALPPSWPFEDEAWRPGTTRANLLKAIAIAWAVVDRLDAEPDAA